MNKLCEFTLFEIYPKDVQLDILGWYQSEALKRFPNYNKIPTIIQCFESKPYPVFKRRVIQEYLRTTLDFKDMFVDKINIYANEHVTLDHKGKPILCKTLNSAASTDQNPNTISSSTIYDILDQNFNNNQSHSGAVNKSKSRRSRKKVERPPDLPLTSSDSVPKVEEDDNIPTTGAIAVSDNELEVLKARVKVLDNEIIQLKLKLSKPDTRQFRDASTQCTFDTADASIQCDSSELPATDDITRRLLDSNVVPYVSTKSVKVKRYLSERKFISHRLFRHCINAFHTYCPIPFRQIKALFSAIIADDRKSGT